MLNVWPIFITKVPLNQYSIYSTYFFLALALTIDIAHPNVSSDLKTKRFKKESSGDGKTHTPLVFAVYSGRPQVLQGTLATISPEKLISFTSSPENEQSGLLCSRARDLFEAMVNQVSAVQA